MRTHNTAHTNSDDEELRRPTQTSSHLQTPAPGEADVIAPLVVLGGVHRSRHFLFVTGMIIINTVP